jgi:hypothetical protein
MSAAGSVLDLRPGCVPNNVPMFKGWVRRALPFHPPQEAE